MELQSAQANYSDTHLDLNSQSTQPLPLDKQPPKSLTRAELLYLIGYTTSQEEVEYFVDEDEVIPTVEKLDATWEYKDGSTQEVFLEDGCFVEQWVFLHKPSNKLLACLVAVDVNDGYCNDSTLAVALYEVEPYETIEYRKKIKEDGTEKTK